MLFAPGAHPETKLSTARKRLDIYWPTSLKPRPAFSLLVTPKTSRHLLAYFTANISGFFITDLAGYVSTFTGLLY